MKNRPGRPAGTTMDPRFKREMAKFRFPAWINDELAQISNKNPAAGGVGKMVERILIDVFLLTPPE